MRRRLVVLGVAVIAVAGVVHAQQGRAGAGAPQGVAGVVKAAAASLGLAIVPSIFLIVGMIVMPESPRWLFAHDREELLHPRRRRLAREQPFRRRALTQDHQDVHDM